MTEFTFLIYLAIFLLTAMSIFLISGLNAGIGAELRRRKMDETMKPRKRSLRRKLMRLEDRYRKLIDEVQIPRPVFWLLTVLCVVGGAVVGKLFFSHTFFAVAVGILGSYGPWLYLSFRQTRSRSQRIEKILSSMMLLSNSYIVTDDFVQSVQDNIDALEYRAPFRDFLIYINYINSSIKTGMRRMELQVDNPYFAQWIDVLIMAQDDRSMKYVTLSVVDSMIDLHQAQQESDTAMYTIWREYFTVLALIFAAPLIFRVLMKSAYTVLVTTLPGQILLTLLLAAVVYSLVKAVAINKPLLI